MKRLALALAMIFAGCPAFAQQQPPAQLDNLQRADGAKLVPERFLRSWDPITLFFDSDVGPAAGGPEDNPDSIVTLKPGAAGAWQWLGARALQFRPADAWKPLQTVDITAQGRTTRLVPLLPAPISTAPTEKSEGTTDLNEITLTFAEPIDVGALRRLMSIELRPSPGIAAAGGQFLTAQDFTVEPVERAKRDENQAYLVRLKTAVPDGNVAILRLRLFNEPGLDDPQFELRLKSAVPFTVTDADCGSGLASETTGRVLRCSPYAGWSDNDEAGAYKAGPGRKITVSFSAKPEALDIVRARDALRLTPAVDDLGVEADGPRLRLSGRFLADTVYELRIAPNALMDVRHRPLEGPVFTRSFAFAASKPSLKWDTSQGIVERFGPQSVPLRGHGYDRADIRIHRIDGQSRDFWPFPPTGVHTDDVDAPPLPGKEPARWSETGNAASAAIALRIKALGSPAVSELAGLPIQRGGVDAKFGLDLKPMLGKISGAEQPGVYLVGMRAIDATTRDWMRIQVTDLALSAAEEPGRVRFTVTSLASAKPVSGASIRLDGVREDKFVALVTGETGADGAFTWDTGDRSQAEIRRMVVAKGLDTLVLEPANAPAQYAGENWSKPDESWLAWTVNPKQPRTDTAHTLCHVFTERPIYRPEEPVLIKGYVRTYLGGALSYAKAGGTLVVSGPANQEWRIPVKLDAIGGFFHKFDAATPATGDYSVKFEPDGKKPGGEKAESWKSEVEKLADADAAERDEAAPDQTAPDMATTGDDDAEAAPGDGEAVAADTTSCGAFPFKKEAYRLPTFEVVLNAPQQTPLDGEFNVDLIARYFAGGLVADRPITWRAVQFPYAWTPPGRDGFLFSTDARFSGEGKFKSTPVLQREGRTDGGGSARLTFDTTIEPTAQPRRYSIEATVTGDDDLQVRNVRNVIALPPFVLGVKIPRYLPKAGAVEPEILALDAKGQPVAGLELTVRFIRRNWTSMLQASDFSQGSAKYVTQVIDETLVERKVTSLAEAQKLAFETREAGVYLVQVEGTDRIGRRQQVSVDFFVGGDTPVTWARPPAQTAAVTTDKEAYAPGETATLIIQSPFQTAQALAIVEEPEGRFRYDWVEISNGFGRYPITVRKEELPRLAVHFLIMRGRLPDTVPNPTAPFDQGKPVTIAATKWLTVTPVKNIVTAKLEAPAKARPGQEIEVTLRLADDLGQPIAGEAVFWMVDQAVLSLAKEAPLDPLPNFIVERPTRMALRDTRNMAFGIIPLEETPGGDAGQDEWGAENNISVRKNFTPVPIYLPNVVVGPDGVAKIKVKLPDTLTVFKLRAKAVSGPDRFGYATGEMLIRQELVAQAALPRFVRPGDTFDAGVIGRVVEGPGGTGRVTMAASGVVLDGSPEQSFAWAQNRPARLDFPVRVSEPTPGKEQVRFQFTLRRDADQAADAVQIDLPIRADRPPVRDYQLATLAAAGSLSLQAPAIATRPLSYRRDVTLASDPAVVRLIAGLDALAGYPFGCTEQRISLASAALAMKPFAAVMAAAGLDARLPGDVRNTLQAIDQAIDPDGLVAFWPKSRGNVSLTAWAYSFALAAQAAGEPVDKTLIERLGNVLKLALRSDYGRLISGDEMRERVEALTALAEGGALDQSYVAELSRRADGMANASLAQVTAAVARLPGDDKRVLGGLMEKLWARVKILSREGKPYYAGQAGDAGNPVILPSETRNLAEITRAVALATPDDARLGLLQEGIIRLGEGDGWGSTNANAAAIKALATIWQRPKAQLPVTVTQSGAATQWMLDGNTPVMRRSFADSAAITLANAGAAPIIALVETRYQPSEPGSQAQAVAKGFVLTRALLKIASGGGPAETVTADAQGALSLKVGDVVEDVVELANPEDRTHVAISIPLAAGMEPLNPNIATAPAEATPSSAPTLAPTWTSFGDDRVFYAYDRLPKGNYRFAFRSRVLTPGSFTQPSGEAETMYQRGVYGASPGRRIVIGR